jgi:hypothetical protein
MPDLLSRVRFFRLPWPQGLGDRGMGNELIGQIITMLSLVEIWFLAL